MNAAHGTDKQIDIVMNQTLGNPFKSPLWTLQSIHRQNFDGDGQWQNLPEITLATRHRLKREAHER
jgi:hypothetical protein